MVNKFPNPLRFRFEPAFEENAHEIKDPSVDLEGVVLRGVHSRHRVRLNHVCYGSGRQIPKTGDPLPGDVLL